MTDHVPQGKRDGSAERELLEHAERLADAGKDNFCEMEILDFILYERSPRKLGISPSRIKAAKKKGERNALFICLEEAEKTIEERKECSGEIHRLASMITRIGDHEALKTEKARIETVLKHGQRKFICNPPEDPAPLKPGSRPQRTATRTNSSPSSCPPPPK